MGRLLWPLAVVVTFVLGLAAGGVAWKGQSAVPEVDQLRETVGHLRETVSRLQQQVSTLQARLRARENLPALRQPGATAHADAPRGSTSRTGTRLADRSAAAAVTEDLMLPDRPGRGGGAAQPQVDRASNRPGSRGTAVPAPPATVEAALDRFYRFLEATKGPDGPGSRVRDVINDLRAMGDVGAQALMQVLVAGNDSDERRAAAHLLGSLQVPQALPLLRDIIEREDDLLLRRAAATGLRRLQTPDSVPVMERVLANTGEDRFVRLSAAYGLAESGRPLGVVGLAQIFEESTADGRGRDMAFRALAALKDERPLPFMRQLVTSHAEPSYRLQAIRYLTTQGDRQALAGLQLLMQSPNEQPSIRDAAAHAHAVISGR